MSDKNNYFEFKLLLKTYFDVLFKSCLHLFSHYIIGFVEVLSSFAVSQNGPGYLHVLRVFSRNFPSIGSHSCQTQVLHRNMNILLHVLLNVWNVQRDWCNRYVCFNYFTYFYSSINHNLINLSYYQYFKDYNSVC